MLWWNHGYTKIIKGFSCCNWKNSSTSRINLLSLRNFPACSTVLPYYRFHKMCIIEIEVLGFNIKQFNFFPFFLFFNTLVKKTQPPCNRLGSYVAFSSGIAILDTRARFIYKPHNRNGTFAQFAWHILKHFETPRKTWNTLKHLETLWNILKQV